MLSTQSLQLKRFYFAFVLIAGFAVAVVGVADKHGSMPSGDASIVSPDAKLELLFSDAFFTEGAAVAPDGSVYFSDITFTHGSDMQADTSGDMTPRPERLPFSVHRAGCLTASSLMPKGG